MNPEPDPMIEASILAGLLHYGSEVYHEANSILRTESFVIVENQIIWKVLCAVLASGTFESVDRPTLYIAAKNIGAGDYFDNADIRKHIETLYRIPVDLASIERFCVQLRIIDVARELRGRLQQADELLSGVTGNESIDQIFRLGEQPVQSVMNELSGGVKFTRTRHISDGLRERLRERIKNPVSLVGIPTGFNRFDGAHGGCRAGSLILVCARMKTGKTMFTNNIAVNVAEQLRIPVLNIDTEMEIEQQQFRAAACLSGLWTDDLECGHINRDQQVKLGAAIKRLEEMPYYYEQVKGLPFEDILTRIRRWVARYVGFESDGKAKPCIIVFDYFQLMTEAELSSRVSVHHKMGFQASALKDLMGELGVPCISFAQANRDGMEFRDERILRDADRILDKVTAFWVFRRKGDGEIMPARRGELRFTHELYYCMSRFGKGLDRENYINIGTDYSRGLMIEGPTRDELFQQNGGHLKGVGDGKVSPAADAPEGS